MNLADALGHDDITAPRVNAPVAAPSFRLLDGGAYELTTSSDVDAEGATAELEALGVHVPQGWVARLVEAKADPAAWHRDAQGDDAVTRPIVRRKFIVERVPVTESGRDVAALVQWVLDRPAAPPVTNDAPANHLGVGAFVVVQADPQLGKTGSGGGTEETLAAITDKLAAARDLARHYAPEVIHYADLGDGCEGTEAGGPAAYTNDLSFTDQFDLFNAVTLAGTLGFADIAPTWFDAVPSNHMQQRANHRATGAAHDDFGVLNAKLLARLFKTAGRDDIRVITPERHHETMTLDIAGLNVGMAHGHQVQRPDGIPLWWQKQTFGAMPLAAAKLLITGHFHHLRIERLGTDRMWMQGDTLDVGSDWYAATTGSQSVRGLLTFTITAGKVDHIRVL